MRITRISREKDRKLQRSEKESECSVCVYCSVWLRADPIMSQYNSILNYCVLPFYGRE